MRVGRWLVSERVKESLALRHRPVSLRGVVHEGPALSCEELRPGEEQEDRLSPLAHRCGGHGAHPDLHWRIAATTAARQPGNGNVVWMTLRTPSLGLGPRCPRMSRMAQSCVWSI